MAQEGHTQVSVVLAKLFGADYPTIMVMKEVNVEIMERKMEIEEYNPHDRGLKDRLPAYITCWVQIRLSDWFARKWERGGRGSLPGPDYALAQDGPTGGLGYLLPHG